MRAPEARPMRGGDDPYVLDVPAGVLSRPAIRAVVPLLPAAAAPQPIGDPCPVTRARWPGLVGTPAPGRAIGLF